MKDGLVSSLMEMLERGHVTRLGSGMALTPRIVLMTDGEPTKDGSSSDDAKKEVLATAVAFGPKHADVNLPFPVYALSCSDVALKLVLLLKTLCAV